MGTNYHVIGITDDDPNDIIIKRDAIPGVPLRWSRYAASGSDDTTTAAKNIIAYDTSGGAGSFELKTADLLNGEWYLIKDESGTATTNNITVTTEGSETIDNLNQWVINSDYGYVLIYSDTVNWFSWSSSTTDQKLSHWGAEDFTIGSTFPATGVENTNVPFLGFNQTGNSILWSDRFHGFVSGQNFILVLVWYAPVNTGTVIWEGSYGVQTPFTGLMTTYSTPVSSGAVTVPGTAYDLTYTILTFPTVTYDDQKIMGLKVARNGGTLADEDARLYQVIAIWTP